MPIKAQEALREREAGPPMGQSKQRADVGESLVISDHLQHAHPWGWAPRVHGVPPGLLPGDQEAALSPPRGDRRREKRCLNSPAH